MPYDTDTQALLERHASKLDQLISVGCGGPLLATMADLALVGSGQPRMASELLAYVGGPIVVHHREREVPPEHPLPKFRDAILSERVRIGLGLSPFLVGPAEITAVAFQQVLEQAMEPEVSNVIVWANLTALAKVGIEKDVPALYERLRADIEGGHVELTEHQVLHQQPYAAILREIATRIREKVVGLAGKHRRSELIQPDLLAAF